MIHDHYKLYRTWRSMRCTSLFLFVYDVVGSGDVRMIDPFLLSSVSSICFRPNLSYEIAH
jgi:hypothetical protein